MNEPPETIHEPSFFQDRKQVGLTPPIRCCPAFQDAIIPLPQAGAAPGGLRFSYYQMMVCDMYIDKGVLFFICMPVSHRSIFLWWRVFVQLEMCVHIYIYRDIYTHVLLRFISRWARDGFTFTYGQLLTDSSYEERNVAVRRKPSCVQVYTTHQVSLAFAKPYHPLLTVQKPYRPDWSNWPDWFIINH